MSLVISPLFIARTTDSHGLLKLVAELDNRKLAEQVVSLQSGIYIDIRYFPLFIFQLTTRLSLSRIRKFDEIIHNRAPYLEAHTQGNTGNTANYGVPRPRSSMDRAPDFESGVFKVEKSFDFIAALYAFPDGM